MEIRAFQYKYNTLKDGDLTVYFIPVVFLEEEASSGKEFIFISKERYKEQGTLSFGYRIIGRGELGLQECFGILTQHFEQSLSIFYIKIISRVGTTMVVSGIDGGENIVIVNNGVIHPAPVH